MSTKKYAEGVAKLKENLYSRGKLREEYKAKVEQNVPEELRGIIISCIEDQDVDDIQKQFEKAKSDLKYYFMDKGELIDRIKELEEKYENTGQEDK